MNANTTPEIKVGDEYAWEKPSGELVTVEKIHKTGRVKVAGFSDQFTVQGNGDLWAKNGWRGIILLRLTGNPKMQEERRLEIRNRGYVVALEKEQIRLALIIKSKNPALLAAAAAQIAFNENERDRWGVSV